MDNALMAKKAEEQFSSLFLRLRINLAALERTKNCDFHHKGIDLLQLQGWRAQYTYLNQVRLQFFKEKEEEICINLNVNEY